MDVRIGGGVTIIQQYLRVGLIDELLAIAPIMQRRMHRLGEGGLLKCQSRRGTTDALVSVSNDGRDEILNFRSHTADRNRRQGARRQANEVAPLYAGRIATWIPRFKEHGARRIEAAGENRTHPQLTTS